MKILFHLGHPAHFHLFKHTIWYLEKVGYVNHCIIKTKDVLEQLVKLAGFKYTNILPDGRKLGRFGSVMDFYLRGKAIRAHCRSSKTELLIGTSSDIGYVGRLLGIPSINVIEDDSKNIPTYALISYPFANQIVSPECCDNSFWNNKTTFYSGYHELAYLHPKYFKPDKSIVNEYVGKGTPFSLIRLTAFDAYHDHKKRGLTDTIVAELIKVLSQKGKVFITSERKLPDELKKFQLMINPCNIHHFLACSQFFISDSQTMSAEAAVLGVPNIRYHDDVGRLGYLNELEHNYGLSVGILPGHQECLFEIIEHWLNQVSEIKEHYQNQRQRMLSEKVDVTQFLISTITNYF